MSLEKLNKWTFALSTIVVAVQLSALLACRSSKGGERPEQFGDPHEGLQCILEPLKKEYRTGEQIIFRFKLKNIGNTAICLPDETWNRSDGTGHVYVGDPDSAVDLRTGVLFPLMGWEKVEAGQELTCLTSGLWSTSAAKGKKFQAEVKIAPQSQDYKGWSGLIYSSEVSVNIVGPDVDGPDRSTALSWDDPDTCAYAHFHGSSNP